MSGYVVTLAFEVGDADRCARRDVMDGWWAVGREFCLLDPPMLTLVAEVDAPGRGDAFEAVLAQAELVWSLRGGDALPPPRTARVEPVPAAADCGPGGRGPDRLIAEAVAGRAACLRAAAAALVDLEREPEPATAVVPS